MDFPSGLRIIKESEKQTLDDAYNWPLSKNYT